MDLIGLVKFGHFKCLLLAGGLTWFFLRALLLNLVGLLEFWAFESFDINLMGLRSLGFFRGLILTWWVWGVLKVTSLDAVIICIYFGKERHGIDLFLPFFISKNLIGHSLFKIQSINHHHFIFGATIVPKFSLGDDSAVVAPLCWSRPRYMTSLHLDFLSTGINIIEGIWFLLVLNFSFSFSFGFTCYFRWRT